MISNINTAGRYIVVNKYREEHGENATVSLTPEAELIFQWATVKMAEDLRITQLSLTNPTVADAAQALKTAEEQLRVVVALVK